VAKGNGPGHVARSWSSPPSTSASIPTPASFTGLTIASWAPLAIPSFARYSTFLTDSSPTPDGNSSPTRHGTDRSAGTITTDPHTSIISSHRSTKPRTTVPSARSYWSALRVSGTSHHASGSC